MYTIYKVIAILFLLFILFISLIGFFSKRDTTLKYATVTESPSPVVWQYITDLEKIVQWRQKIDKMEIQNMKEMNNDAVIKYYQNGMEYQERVIEWIPGKKVTFQRIDDKSYPIFSNIITSLEINALIGGSTEINIIFKYKLQTFFARIYDTLYLKHYFKDQYEKELSDLKDTLEKV